MASCTLKSKLEQQKKELRELLVYSKNEVAISEMIQSETWLDDAQKDAIRSILGSEIEKMITAEVKYRRDNIYKHQAELAKENVSDERSEQLKSWIAANSQKSADSILKIRDAINNDSLAKMKMSALTVTNPDAKFKVLDLSFKRFAGNAKTTLLSAMSEMLREINGPKFDEKQAKMKKEVMALYAKEQEAIANNDADLANKYAAQKDRLLDRIDGTALETALLSIGGLHDNSENFPKIFATTQKYDSKKVDPATGEMRPHQSVSISTLKIVENTLDAETIDGNLVSAGTDEVSALAMLFNVSGNIIELPDYAKNVIKMVSLESMEDVYKMLGYEPRTKEFDDVWGLDRTDPEYDSYLAAAEEAHLNGYIPQATIITSLGKAVYRGLPVRFSKELDVELEQKAIAQLGMYTLQYMTNIKLISRQDQIVKFGENKSHILIRANNSNSKEQPEVRADKIMALVSELQYLGISERRNAPRRYVEGETYQASQTIRNSFLPTSEEVRDSLRAYESTRFKFNDHMQLLYDVYMNPNGGKEAAYAMAGVLEVDKSKSAIDQMKELAKINYAKMQIDEMMKVYEEFGSDTEFTLPYDYTVSGRYMVNSIFNPQESKISRFLVTTKDIDSTIRRGDDRKLNTEDKQIFEVGLAQSFDLDPDKTTDENAIAALSKIVTISEYGAVKFTDMYKGKPNPFKAVYDMLDGALEGDVTEDMQKTLMAANRAGSGFHAIQAIMALKQLDKASKEKLDNSEIKLSFSLESDAITSGMILTLMQIGTPRAMALAAKGGVYTKETIAHWENLYKQYRTTAIGGSMDALQDKNGDFKLTHGWLKEFSKDFTKKVKESNMPEEQKAALIKAGAFSDFYETVAVTANEEMQVIANQIAEEIKETDKKIEAETDKDKKAVLIKARAELVNAQNMTKMIGQVKRSLAKPPVMVYIYGATIDSIKKKMLDSIVMPKIYDILLSDTLSKVKYPDLIAVLFTLEGGRKALIASLAKEAMAKDEKAEAQVVLDAVTAQVEILATILDPSKGDPKVEFKVVEDNAIKNDENMLVRNMIIPETTSMRIKKAVDATLGKSFEKGFSEFDEIDAYRDSVKVAEVVRFTMFKYKLNKGINRLIKRLKAGSDGEYKISARDISIVISELEASGFGHSVNDINGGKQPLYKKDVLEKEIRTVLSLVAKEKGKQSVFSFALEGKSFAPNTGASGVITVHNIDGFIDSVSARMFDLIRIYDGSVSGINALDGSVTAYNKTVLETTGWNSYGKQVNDLAKQLTLLQESGELYDMIETMSAQDKDALLNTVERLMGYGEISEFDIIDKIGTAKVTTQMRMLANKKFRNEGNTELAIMHSYLSDATDPYVGNMSTLSDNVFAEPQAIEDIYNTYEQILFKLQEYKADKAASAPKVINKKKLAESLAKLEDQAVQAIPAFKPGQKTMRWAGIGSRETPLPLLSKMTEVGEFLGKIGYVLHSGGAIGADMAFEGKPYPLALTAKEDIYNKKGEKIMSAGETAEPGSKTYTNAYYVFSDNKGGSNKFEKPSMSAAPTAKPRVISFSANNVDDKARALAAAVHPGYNNMVPYAQDLMARNGYQVFGKDLDSPVDFVLFYAEETDNPLRPKGGTGQAVELARLKGVPTINMAEEGWGEKLREVIGLKKKSGETATQTEPLPASEETVQTSGSDEQAEAPSPVPAKPIATSAKKGTNKYELSDGVYANGDQEAAIDDIKRFYKSKKQSFLLLGRGGTGKTTIISKAIQELHLRASQLTFATPTHKARKVLEAANRKAGQRAPVSTIAKLLGIMKDDRDGKFKVMTKGKMNDSIKLIVVDEASMVGSVTKKMLEDAATKYGAKIIYMGDNVQLPPVNDRGVNNELVQPLKESAVFAELANGDNYAQLKERMRQGTESPILPVTDVVAAEVEKGGSFAGLQFDGITRYDAKKDEGVIYSNEDEEVLLDQFIKDYKKDPMNTRWINYNNHIHDNTRALIIKIRNKLFGEEVAFNNEFIKGEQVFLTAKFGEDFDNGDEFQIESMSKPKDYTVQYSIWNDDRKRYIDKEITLNATMLSLKDQINGDVYDKMPMLTDDGMSELRSKIKNKKEFDKIMTNFLSLSYAYVINAHKSQGSTYRNVYVDFNNIKANSAFDQDTGLKALYVATSRPSKKLVIMGYDADNQAAPIINQSSRATDVSVSNGAISMNDILLEDADYVFGTNEDTDEGYVSFSPDELAIMNNETLTQEQKDIMLNNILKCDN